MHFYYVGQEQETKACGSIILCTKKAQFLDLWLNAYLDDYRMEEWAYNSGQVCDIFNQLLKKNKKLAIESENS